MQNACVNSVVSVIPIMYCMIINVGVLNVWYNASSFQNV